MSFDLTDKNIKDTYQNLLQKTGSDGRLYDLTGNKVRDLTIDGTLTANTYITSESIVNTSSGSTAFGNSSDDSHTFQGHITASGNISGSKDTDLTIGGKMTLVGSDGDGLIMNANEPIISLNPGGAATARIGYTEKSIRLNNSSLSFSTVGHLVVSSSGLTTADALVGVGVEKPASTLDVGGNINTNSHITASGHISGSSTSTIQVGGAVTGEMKHMFFHSGNWSSGVTLGGVTTVYIPLNSTVESSTLGEQHQIIAPFNGTLLKIVFRALNGSNPGNMTAKFQKNGVVVVTEDITGVTINNNAVFSFSTNNAFNAGDVLALALNVVTDTGDFIVTSVFQFDTNTIIS